MSRTSENSFHSIIKNTSIFGGVQIFLVLINILRGKCVALLLGPAGMGISSLFTSTANVISQMTSFGLNLAVVKEVSTSCENRSRYRILISLIKRLLCITSLIGALFCFLFSTRLSNITFGTSEYSWQFILLGAFVFVTNINNGCYSVLQGLHQVKRLSYASLVGASAGLFIGVPLYYFYGTTAIVPAMILSALTMYCFYRYHLHRVHSINSVGDVSIEKVPFHWSEHKDVVKRLLVLGGLLMASDLISRACSYCINVYIRFNDDISTVGLYQAGYSITAQYVGTVFTALSLDYFPRLTKVMQYSRLMSAVVNRQCIVVSLVIAPLVCLLILSTPILIPLLLSSEFQQIVPFVRLMGLVMLTRGFLFPLGFIAFAGDRKRMFFWMEAVTANLMTLVFSLIGYRLGGLEGLAVGMLVDNIMCMVLYLVVNRRVFGYRMSMTVAKEFIWAAGACLALWLCSFIAVSYISLTLMLIIAATVSTYSIVKLRRLLKH